jgi:hypothetical protein
MSDSLCIPIRLDVLRALALQVRVFSSEQISRAFCHRIKDGCAPATKTLAALQRLDLIRSQIMEVHPLLPLDQPLFRWKPGNAHPSKEQFAAIAKASHDRWTKPHVPIQLFMATKRASRLFGVFVDTQRLKMCEATHDYHLAEVFVRYRVTSPASTARWWGEAAFPKLGFEVKRFKDPDAFLLNSDGEATRVIEFAGSYDEDHLTKFHRHCSGEAAKQLEHHFRKFPGCTLARLYSPNGTSYELW